MDVPLDEVFGADESVGLIHTRCTTYQTAEQRTANILQ